jgi:transcriptional regulator with XRE-family HTH domain
MEKISQPKTPVSNFGRLLAEKRSKAGLSLQELAELSGLSLSFLESLECRGQGAPGFDVCYRIAQAINARQQQGFVVQDLWQAASMDRVAMRLHAAVSCHQQKEVAPADHR